MAGPARDRRGVARLPVASLPGMERLGLVGLPNSGKGPLFTALTGLEPDFVAAKPGIAFVSDDRLTALAEMSRSKKVVPATIEWLSIPDLDPENEANNARVLGEIREVDAVCLVVPAAAAVDELETLELQLVVADATSAANHLEKRSKSARKDKSLAGEVAALEKAVAALDAGTPVYRAGFDAETRAQLAPSFLLTDKKVLVVVDLGEEGDEAAVTELAAHVGDAAEVVGVRAGIEAGLVGMEPGEIGEYLEMYGLAEPALPRVVRAAYHLLGRRTFLTTGDKESRAWTFRAGARAPECAGVIHTDLQRGFIRAEVIRWDELLELGSWSAARDAGKLRIEGKDYEVVDGDVLEIRFNV